MSILENLNGRRRAAKSVPASVAVAALIGLAVVSWGAGMRMGYRFALQDAARVLQGDLGQDRGSTPKWREWAYSDLSYEPPENQGAIFDMLSVRLPGGGGIETADVYNAYQTRIEEEIFERRAVEKHERENPLDRSGNRHD